MAKKKFNTSGVDTIIGMMNQQPEPELEERISIIPEVQQAERTWSGDDVITDEPTSENPSKLKKKVKEKKTRRIDMVVEPSVYELAIKASRYAGMSLTEYITELIKLDTGVR